MKQEQARLGGNRHFDLVRQNQAAAAFEDLLVQEDLDQSLKLEPVGFGKARVESDVLLDDRQPVRRKGRGCQRLRLRCLNKPNTCCTSLTVKRTPVDSTATLAEIALLPISLPSTARGSEPSWRGHDAGRVNQTHLTSRWICIHFCRDRTKHRNAGRHAFCRSSGTFALSS